MKFLVEGRMLLNGAEGLFMAWPLPASGLWHKPVQSWTSKKKKKKVGG